MLLHGLADLRDNGLLAEVLDGHPFAGRHDFQLPGDLFGKPDDDILAGSVRITPPLAET
jgi:hypothetical protein